MRKRHPLLLPSLLSLCVLGGVACTLDPVHQDAVDALGGSEGPYPDETEFHRRGQPCVLCHGGKGPADTEFLLGGTVFWGKCDDPKKKDDCNRAPVGNAHVRIRSAVGAVRCFTTNAAGNFYVKKSDWSDFKFPYLATVEKDGTVRVMGSHASREGSCAACHKSEASQSSPGQIYMVSDKSSIPADAKAQWPAPSGYKQEPKECTP